MRRSLALPLILVVTSAASAVGDEGTDPLVGETVIEAEDSERPENHLAKRGLLQGRQTGPNPEEALAASPALTLLRSGGPLATTRVEMRGLSGSRLAVDVAGLALGAPSSGAVDVGLLPWLSLAAVDVQPGASSRAIGGSLSFEVLDASWARAQVRVGAGSLDTIDVGALAAGPLGPGRALVAVSAARSGGGFSFRPSSPTGAVRETVRRTNNDQARASSLINVGTDVLGFEVDLLTLIAGREGGVPGFASAPTLGLRGRHASLGGRLRVRHVVDIFQARLLLNAQAALRVDHRATRAENEAGWNAVNAVGTDASFGADLDHLPGRTRLHAAARLERAEISGSAFRRQGLQGEASLVSRPLSWLDVSAAASASYLTDIGFLWTGHLGAALGPRWLRGVLRLSRASRAPTLSELYAPRGFFVGNPDLQPESATELDLGLRTVMGSLLYARVTSFVGRVDDAILLLNRNAFEIAATNTGGLWRAGFESELALRPHRLVALEAAARLLLSRLDVTGAPMPVAPPLTGRTVLRLGGLRTPHLQLVTRYRSSSLGTLFGTLPVPGYILTDLVARWPLTKRFRLVGSLSNIFDHLTARDLNGLPLPGRQIYASVEARL